MVMRLHTKGKRRLHAHLRESYSDRGTNRIKQEIKPIDQNLNVRLGKVTEENVRCRPEMKAFTETEHPIQHTY